MATARLTATEMATRRAATKEAILNTKPPKRKFLGLLGLQGAIFAFVFANIELVLGSPAQVILFPAATGVSIFATYETIRSYRREKNKSLGKKVGVGVALLSTLIEVVAVAAAVGGYMLEQKWNLGGFNLGYEFIPQVTAALTGYALGTFTVVPVMFVAMLGINFLSHFSKMLIHGVKMGLTYHRDKGAYSKKFEHHKQQFLDNLRMSVVLGVSGAAVGLLLMTPALHLATLSAGLITAIKVTASTVAGLNGLYTWRNTYQLYKMRKAQKAAEKAAEAPVAVSELSPSNSPVPAPKPEIRPEVQAHYTKPGAFTGLENHIGDLITKMDVISGNPYKPADPGAPESPKSFMLEFIKQEKTVLRNAFKDPVPPPGAAPAVVGPRSNEGEEKEQEDEDTQTLKPKFFLDPRAQSLRDKLQVLDWFKELVLKGHVNVRYSDGTFKPQTTVAGLLEYVEKNSGLKEKNIFGSFANNKGGMQKVAALLSEYLHNPKYDPNTGDKFTGPHPQVAIPSDRAEELRRSRISLRRSSATAG